MNLSDFLSSQAIELLVVLAPLVAVPLVALLVATPLRRRAGRPADLVPALSSDGVATRGDAETEAPLQPVEELAEAPVAEPAPPAEAPPVAAATPQPEPEPVAEPAKPRVSLRERLTGTSQALFGRLNGLLSGRTLDSNLLEELETVLFTADLGVNTAESLLELVRKQSSGGDASAVQQILRDAILAKLRRVQPEGDPLALPGGPPHVVLVLGVNGSGKTTTIGKLAARYIGAGKTVILGAGDTFRAAASDQLQIWGDRVGCDVIHGKPGGDPAAVAFDTVKAARARGVDVAIIDTAGRLQTRRDLMDELGKIARVIGKEIPGGPHDTLLVLDANTGQNAISQARLFTEATDVTGLVLTKLDGTAKGGVIIGLADEFGIPVRYVGVGEGIEDLQDFEAEPFVEAIFSD